MRARHVAPLSVAVLSLSALPACTTAVHIPPSQAPALADERPVKTAFGRKEKIGDKFTVTLVPHDGWELMRRDERSSLIVPIREEEADAARDSGWIPAPAMQSPLSARLTGPTLVLENRDDLIRAPLAAVPELEVRKGSKGKTAGLVIGLVVGGIAVGVGIGVAVAVASIGGIR